jgi:hypothetical protein
VVAAWVVEQLVRNRPAYAQAFAADWLPVAAAGIAAAGVMLLNGRPQWPRLQRGLLWSGLLLMVWAANGLPFDLLTAAGLIGHRTASGAVVLSSVYWPGLATRALALAAVVVLARLALARPAAPVSTRPATWYAGAAGQGWEPLLIAIPWVLAAGLSLLLVSPPHWVSRRLLLAAGWSATAIVAMIGPAAFWSFVSALASGSASGSGEIEVWVFGLFYCSWFLFAIAAGAATRSYQLRSAGLPTSSLA